MGLFFSTSLFADQVLVTIGETGKVTERQLESAMQAVPFATQFPAMDEKDQAYLRGDVLLRLARAEVLYQEAVAEGIKRTRRYQQEMNSFKTALLAQHYLADLRSQIKIPEKLEQQFKAQLAGNSDAYKAAHSAYVAKAFTELKKNAIAKLRKAAGVETFFELLQGRMEKDTPLAQGEGISMTYGDLLSDDPDGELEQGRIIAKVNERIDLTLMAQAAPVNDPDIEAQLADYARILAIRLLLAEKQQQWIPDEQTLVDYFQKHPKMAYVPERRQIGQIVLASRAEAEVMRSRILAGESLFTLAGQYSIDPYGRQHAGDMGWLRAGSAASEIEQGIKKLADNQVSGIIKTDKGWHLIVIVNRKPSERKTYAAIKDRVKQQLLAEKMAVYLQEVSKKHPLQWTIAEHGEPKSL